MNITEKSHGSQRLYLSKDVLVFVTFIHTAVSFNCYSSVRQKRTGSAEPSCVSMKSNQSMDPPLRFNDGNKCR